MQFPIHVQRPICCILLRATAVLFVCAFLSVTSIACAGQTDGGESDNSERPDTEATAMQTPSDTSSVESSGGDRSAPTQQLAMQTSSQTQKRTAEHGKTDSTEIQFPADANQVSESNSFLLHSEYRDLILDILQSTESFNCELVQRGNGLEAHWMHAIGQKIEVLPNPEIILDIEAHQVVALRAHIDDLVLLNQQVLSPSPLANDTRGNRSGCVDGRMAILVVAKQILDQLEHLVFIDQSSSQPPTPSMQVKRQVPLLDFLKDGGIFNCSIYINNISHQPFAAWLQGVGGDEYSLISDDWVLSGEDVQTHAADWRKTFIVDSNRQTFGDQFIVHLLLDEHAGYGGGCSCLESCEDHRMPDIIEESEHAINLLAEGQNDCWVRISGNGNRKLKIQIKQQHGQGPVITDMIADAHEARFELIRGNALGEWPSEIVIITTASQAASRVVGCSPRSN